jgi:hypothetical protein
LAIQLALGLDCLESTKVSTELEMTLNEEKEAEATSLMKKYLFVG